MGIESGNIEEVGLWSPQGDYLPFLPRPTYDLLAPFIQNFCKNGGVGRGYYANNLSEHC